MFKARLCLLTMYYKCAKSKLVNKLSNI